MIRVDFVVDDNFKVYLMEANSGPNLSSVSFPRSQILYEQLIYNYLSLVGIGSRIDRTSLLPLPEPTERMLSAEHNIVVNAEQCIKAGCLHSCVLDACRFCRNCLSNEDKLELHDAYREFTNIGEMKRLIPASIDVSKGLNSSEFEKLSPRNKFMTGWYYRKCAMQKEWC